MATYILVRELTRWRHWSHQRAAWDRPRRLPKSVSGDLLNPHRVWRLLWKIIHPLCRNDAVLLPLLPNYVEGQYTLQNNSCKSWKIFASISVSIIWLTEVCNNILEMRQLVSRDSFVLHSARASMTRLRGGGYRSDGISKVCWNGSRSIQRVVAPLLTACSSNDFFKALV